MLISVPDFQALQRPETFKLRTLIFADKRRNFVVRFPDGQCANATWPAAIGGQLLPKSAKLLGRLSLMIRVDCESN